MGRFLSKGAQLSIRIFRVEKRENLEQKKERYKRGVHINQWLRLMLCGSVELFDRCQTPGVRTPYNRLYGEASPERGSFSRRQVYERVGI